MSIGNRADEMRRLVERLAFVGVAANDSEEIRVQKVTLTLAAVTVTVLSVVWAGTYLALTVQTEDPPETSWWLVARGLRARRYPVLDRTRLTADFAQLRVDPTRPAILRFANRYGNLGDSTMLTPRGQTPNAPDHLQARRGQHRMGRVAQALADGGACVQEPLGDVASRRNSRRARHGTAGFANPA